MWLLVTSHPLLSHSAHVKITFPSIKKKKKTQLTLDHTFVKEPRLRPSRRYFPAHRPWKMSKTIPDTIMHSPVQQEHLRFPARVLVTWLNWLLPIRLTILLCPHQTKPEHDFMVRVALSFYHFLGFNKPIKKGDAHQNVGQVRAALSHSWVVRDDAVHS